MRTNLSVLRSSLYVKLESWEPRSRPFRVWSGRGTVIFQRWLPCAVAVPHPASTVSRSCSRVSTPRTGTQRRVRASRCSMTGIPGQVAVAVRDGPYLEEAGYWHISRCAKRHPDPVGSASWKGPSRQSCGAPTPGPGCRNRRGGRTPSRCPKVPGRRCERCRPPTPHRVRGSPGFI